MGPTKDQDPVVAVLGSLQVAQTMPPCAHTHARTQCSNVSKSRILTEKHSVTLKRLTIFDTFWNHNPSTCDFGTALHRSTPTWSEGRSERENSTPLATPAPQLLNVACLGNVNRRYRQRHGCHHLPPLDYGYQCILYQCVSMPQKHLWSQSGAGRAPMWELGSTGRGDHECSA